MAFGWQVVGSLPSDLTSNELICHRGRLYVIGCHDFGFAVSDNVSSQAFSFKIQGDGSLSQAVVSPGNIRGSILFGSGAAAKGDYLYVVGGETLGGYQNLLSVSRLGPDGSVIPLPALNAIMPSNGDGEATIIGEYLYAFTTDGTGNTSSIYSSHLDPNGGFGPFQKLGDGLFQLTPGTLHPKFCSWGNYLYVVGGADVVGQIATTKISSVRVEPTAGALAAGWKYVGDMPVTRFRHSADTNKNTGVLVVVGGTIQQSGPRINTPNCETYLLQPDGTVLPGQALPPLPTKITAPARNAMVAVDSDSGWVYALAGQGTSVIDPLIYAIKIGPNGQAL